MPWPGTARRLTPETTLRSPIWSFVNTPSWWTSMAGVVPRSIGATAFKLAWRRTGARGAAHHHGSGEGTAGHPARDGRHNLCAIPRGGAGSHSRPVEANSWAVPGFFQGALRRGALD